MHWLTKALLILSSLLNAGICWLAFWFMVFGTNPHMDDVTMRIGFYVLNVISALALLAVFAPWFLACRHRNRVAVFTAVLPLLLLGFAALAFVTLDSWLNRTFSRAGGSTSVVASDMATSELGPER